MYLNLRVFIEARGFIRLIQLVMAIIAFATTASFGTFSTFEVRCHEFEKMTQYKFGYPFKLAKSEIRFPEKCYNISDIRFKTYSVPFDFSCSAEFFVATGVVSLMYAGGAIFVYAFMQRLYSTKSMIPILDLIVTGVISISWLAGTTVWGLSVPDIEHCTNPSYIFQYLDICEEPNVCYNTSLGDFTQLYVSLIFGMGNCMLWICSVWFVYKETRFNQKVKQTVKSPQLEKQQAHLEEQAPPMQKKDLIMEVEYKL